MIRGLKYRENYKAAPGRVTCNSIVHRHALMLVGFGLFTMAFLFHSCESFINPDQELIHESEDMFQDWAEYRSAEMGMYHLQQQLVEQIVVLGELRGDLLEVTANASTDLKDIYNFTINRENSYASPVRFYELIAACNNLISQLKIDHPEVTELQASITNYDRLYGEVLCMRAWAYFNAVRIYGEVPYVHESLTSLREIENYVNSEGTYTDSIFIKYGPDGYFNDTIRDTTIVLEKMFLNQKAVIDTFTTQLEQEIKAVGVNHSINNGDVTWQVTVWNEYARHVLLGQMYLFDGDYSRAIEHFNPILYNYSSETSNIKFGLDNKFQNNRWRDIFRVIDPYEHIYTIWFGKSYRQVNELQSMFSVLPPNKYMMRPSDQSVLYWESQWDDPVMELDNNSPGNSVVIDPGIPGDFYRGYGVSYAYYKSGVELSADDVEAMLLDKSKGDHIDVQLMMDGVDTVVTKYSIDKNPYDHDADYIVFRAAGVHLYAAEIYALWSFDHNGIIRPETNTSLNILNNGTYNNRNGQLGVRGRVGFSNQYEAIHINNIIYQHDPVTNKITGYLDYTGELGKKQEYLVDKILEERAREMAFEGERFYDLIRVAKRRNDPSYLADKIAEKFSGAQKEIIREKLMNEENWYIDYY